ncbi:MAG: hypothetical protein IBJ12_02305 [Sphingomonadaceae bacterium]|nr:hypothetical protein [Sphingomonadaceae bacterium]
MTHIIDRRLLLQGAAGIILTATGAKAMNDTSYSTARKPGKITGNGVGDFDFLAGEWKIRHRRLKDGTNDIWEESVSGATVHRVLDGMGSIEELRKPDGSFLGMGVRVWLPQEKKWADHWTSAANGVVNPPQKGEFIDGEGVFISDEEVDGIKWLYRGVWDKITPTSCRWHQSSSKDGGKTWEWNWWIDWTRVS